MKQNIYRGYELRYHQTHQWEGHIFRVGSNLPQAYVLTAPPDWIEEHYLGLWREYIDGLMAKSG